MPPGTSRIPIILFRSFTLNLKHLNHNNFVILIYTSEHVGTSKTSSSYGIPPCTLRHKPPRNITTVGTKYFRNFFYVDACIFGWIRLFMRFKPRLRPWKIKTSRKYKNQRYQNCANALEGSTAAMAVESTTSGCLVNQTCPSPSAHFFGVVLLHHILYHWRLGTTFFRCFVALFVLLFSVKECFCLIALFQRNTHKTK